MPGIDFLDVDHTLTRRSSGARFVSMAIRRHIAPLRLLAIVPYYALTYRLGFFRLREYGAGFPYLSGMKKTVLESVARESFEQGLRGDVYPGAIALVEERKRLGRKLALATSSLDFIVRPLAEFLGIDLILATSLEYRDGICTGMIHGAPLFRQEKQRRVLAYIGQSGARREDCSFYSDSIYDLPLLEEVGNPVAVNPDFRLRRIAQRRNWSIMDFA